MTLPSLHSACPRSHDRSRVAFVRVPPGAGRGHLKTQVGVVGHGGHPEDTGISPGQGAVSWGHRVPGHAGVSSGYGVPRIPRCPGTPYPEDTGGILGKPRYPEDTSGVLGIPYPQDTDGILRIPRCPEDTAGVLRCLNREDAPVSSGHRILRMPSVSHDANLHFQTTCVR